MTYKLGTLIRQNCVRCGVEFDFIYPGTGRPSGHFCPRCKPSPKIKIGSIQTTTCKDCGRQFEFPTTIGHKPERCPDCRPKKKGTQIAKTCIDCGKVFVNPSVLYIHQRCPACRQDYKRRYGTEFKRIKNGAIARGTLISTTCSICGHEFTYPFSTKFRHMCPECQSADNLVVMERTNHSGNGWNRTKWEQTLEAFGGQCAYCGKNIKRFHRDHFIPKAKGGASDIGNIVPACPSCNLHKHCKDPVQFLPEVTYQRVISILSTLKC